MQERNELIRVRDILNHFNVVTAGIDIKTYFVHDLLDQGNAQTASSMFLQALFRAFQFGGIKSFPLIADRDREFGGIGFYSNIDLLILVIVVRMFDNIRACLINSQFDLTDTVVIKTEFFRDTYDKISYDLEIIRSARNIQCENICRTLFHSKNLFDSSFDPRAALSRNTA